MRAVVNDLPAPPPQGFLEPFLEARRFRKLTHLHGIFHHFAGTIKHQLAGLSPANGRHTLIHIVAETLVESHFLVAEMASGGKVAKIEELEVDRFFELVDPVAGQKHRRNMRIASLRVADRVRVERRDCHGLADGFKALPIIHVGGADHNAEDKPGRVSTNKNG